MADPSLAPSGLKKAAILLVLLGDEATAAVYKHLTDKELHALTEEIAALHDVQPALAEQVLREYHQLSMTQEALAEGGPELAAQLLSKAFGEATAKQLLSQLTQAREEVGRSFDALQKTDPKQLVKFVQSEHPQTVAMLLAHLGVRAASALLVLLPEKLRGQSIKRLAEMQQFSPEMAQKISLVLHRKVVSLGEQVRRSYGGVKSAAELLNTIDPAVSKTILEGVESENARLALNIRNSMFTFADFLGVPETAIREILGTVDKKSLATALKGAAEDLKNHFFKTMSSRAVEMLKEDMEALGPVRAQTVTQAQMEIVSAARTLESQGKIALSSDQQEAYVV